MTYRFPLSYIYLGVERCENGSALTQSDVTRKKFKGCIEIVYVSMDVFKHFTPRSTIKFCPAFTQKKLLGTVRYNYL